jgi:spermidine synthase
VSVGTSPALVATSSSSTFTEVLPAHSPRNMGWYFLLFVGSGFCSILYELVWLRLAMAQFGVTTALVSMVLSMFMAGLGLGSWASGSLLLKVEGHSRFSPLRLYALLELMAACSAIAVPVELLWGGRLLEQLGSRLPQSSSTYYLAVGTGLAFTLIPWCACMGATIPVAMSAIRVDQGPKSQRSFSFLYLANVLGAIAGATLPLLVIEIWGFRTTLHAALLVNLILFATALALSVQPADVLDGAVRNAGSKTMSAARPLDWRTGYLALLFATGMSSMGTEVVWIRQFTPYLGTFVYSFALILALYLGATFLGSSLYRAWSRRSSQVDGIVWFLLWLVALLPLLTGDPEIGLSNFVRVLGIVPFSGLMGFVTPMLVDRWSEGDPARAGSAYAVNIGGCILGPLFAGFALLPWMGEHRAVQVLAFPWLVVGLIAMSRVGSSRVRESLAWRASCYVLGLAAVVVIFDTHTFEQQYPRGHVLRDSTATVLADGEGMDKRLFVNGVSITFLTPATKMMSALPLALLDHSPKNALVVCLGMGTTHRSMLSWGIDSTAVELDPSVPLLFWFFHADGNELLRSARSHVVIDDGRRFLERTSDQYDVIVIDPPPPTQAAASSLLYSREFYSILKQRLRAHGIFQQWFADDGDIAAQAAMARSLKESFRYVRAFGSVPKYGYHLIASDYPLPNRSAAELAERLPAAAAADLVEWGPYSNAEQQFAEVLKQEIPLDGMIAKAPGVPALRDDQPVNEYYLLRQWHWAAY